MLRVRTALLVACGVGLCWGFALAGTADFPAPTQGPVTQICNSKDLPDGPHYINDHTLIQHTPSDGGNGTWHLYGIFHHEPADPEHEIHFVHAVATEPDPSKWDSTSFVIPPPGSPVRYALTAQAEYNETHIWAPHVLRDAKRNRWVMVFQASNYGGNNNAAQIKMAVSPDLYKWTRQPTSFIFTDICVARDPKLVHHPDQDLWTIYYTRCNNVTGELSGVGYRTSTDLSSWSEPQMALVLPASMGAPFKPSFNSAASESPFVYNRNGVWYLSICVPPMSYKTTMLFASTDPHHFAPTPVATLDSHCAEWIPTPVSPLGGASSVQPQEGGSWMTSAGWAQGGVYLSPMSWGGNTTTMS